MVCPIGIPTGDKILRLGFEAIQINYHFDEQLLLNLTGFEGFGALKYCNPPI